MIRILTLIAATSPTSAITLALFLLLCGGCATSPPSAVTPGAAVKPSPAISRPTREYRSDEYVVITTVSGDTYDALARSYLGDEKLAYLVSEFNNGAPLTPGSRIVIPLRPENPGGLSADGYLTVPVLCYHRFKMKKDGDKISVSREAFERQLAYLRENGYTTLTLRQFFDFIELRRRPPAKSLLITIDDGWKSVKTIAYPLLKKYGFTAVLFIYTDNIKTRENSLTLTWNDLKELKGSGLFEIESHTVSHADLTKISDEQLSREIGESQRIITAALGTPPTLLAYPYGLFNQKIIDTMRQYGYRGGFTVIRGANAFFHAPYALNRSMIYNSERIEDFVKQLQTFKQESP